MFYVGATVCYLLSTLMHEAKSFACTMFLKISNMHYVLEICSTYIIDVHVVAVVYSVVCSLTTLATWVRGESNV